jgi:hypothetical protein
MSLINWTRNFPEDFDGSKQSHFDFDLEEELESFEKEKEEKEEKISVEDFINKVSTQVDPFSFKENTKTTQQNNQLFQINMSIFKDMIRDIVKDELRKRGL